MEEERKEVGRVRHAEGTIKKERGRGDRYTEGEDRKGKQGKGVEGQRERENVTEGREE